MQLSQRPSGGRILYVEDDAALAAMTCEVLQEAYEVVHFADGQLALNAALHERFDVMVIDRRLPSLDGIALVRAIRTAHIATPILLLTALGAVRERVEGLDAGANDYLVKPVDFDELLARLRALRRGFSVEGKRRMLGDWTFVTDAAVLFGPGGERVALTDTEFRLLSLLSASPEHVFDRPAILRAVFDAGESLSNVDTYVHYIRRKTDPHIIETVRGHGYRAGAS